MGRSYEPRGEQLLQHAVQRLEVRGSWPAVAGASSRSTQARRSGQAGTASKHAGSSSAQAGRPAAVGPTAQEGALRPGSRPWAASPARGEQAHE